MMGPGWLVIIRCNRPGHNDRLSSTFRLCSWGEGRGMFWVDRRVHRFEQTFFVGWPCWGKKNIFDRWKLRKAKIWATCLCVRAIWSSYILISLPFTYLFGNSLPCLVCKPTFLTYCSIIDCNFKPASQHVSTVEVFKQTLPKTKQEMRRYNKCMEQYVFVQNKSIYDTS